MGAELIMNMKAHAQKCGAQFINETALKLETSSKLCTITTNKQTLHAQAVIIATGSGPLQLGCPGENVYWGKGVTVCAICDAALYRNQPVVIVGGGNTAMQNAFFMTKLTNNITIIHILDKLTASAHMQKPVLQHPAIKIIYNSTISEILGDIAHVTHVNIKNLLTQQEQKLPTAAVFLAIGSKPNTDFLKNTIELDATGHIKTFDTINTSAKNIFACGDVIDYRYRQVITASSTGCIAAINAQQYLEQLQ